VVVYGTLQQRSWENQEGERRSKVEILADDIAPSLKWATAQITRNEFRGGGGGGGGGSTEDSASTGGDRAGASETPAYDTDEEPF
jgi:single-strand DNA-binding protein